MDYGLYGYIDKETHETVYIGKDKNISSNERDRMHRAPSRKNKIKINEVIQANPERYEYVVLAKFLVEELMIIAELAFIQKYKPVYNKHFNNENKEIHGGQREYYERTKNRNNK